MARQQNAIKFETKFYEFQVTPYQNDPAEFPRTYSKIRFKEKGAPVSWWKELTPDTAEVLLIDTLGQRILGII